MTAREPQAQLSPLALHRSQLAAADATAIEMGGGPMGPRVSRAWALRELAVWGCRELAALLDGRALVQLRAPNPRRGAPRKIGSPPGPTLPAAEFQTLSPLVVPRALLGDLRALVPRVARATGQHATLAMIVREALLLGHEARQRARLDAEQKAKEQRMILRLAGYPDASALQVVGVGVVTPYLPPGQRSASIGSTDDWGETPKARPRSRAKSGAGSAASKKAPASSRKRAPSAAHGSDRQAPRRRASPTKRKTKAGEGDDEPGAPASTIAHPVGGPTDLRDRGGRR